LINRARFRHACRVKKVRKFLVLLEDPRRIEVSPPDELLIRA